MFQGVHAAQARVLDLGNLAVAADRRQAPGPQPLV
jgi:hypothetical protein